MLLDYQKGKAIVGDGIVDLANEVYLGQPKR